MASDQSAKRVLIDLGFKRATLLQKPSIIDCALGTRENSTSEQPYPQVDSSLSVFAASWAGAHIPGSGKKSGKSRQLLLLNLSFWRFLNE